MTFSNLLAGASVFFDADILIYHFSKDPRYGLECGDLVERAERLELLGFTATHVLGEVAHRLMTIEASRTLGWPFQGIARRLRNHPTEVQKLALFRQAVEAVPKLGIQVLLIPANLIAAGAIISQQTGLLSNDALIVGAMQHYGLVNLASNDTDFDRVTGLTRYGPA